MSDTENKDPKAAEGKEEVKQAATITLTPEEMADIRGLITGRAEDKAEIKKLTGMLAELQGVVSSNIENPSDIEAVPDVGTEARMRKTRDGKWILGWDKKKGVYRERGPLNEIVEYWDLIVLGEEKPVKMVYLDTMNECPQEFVKIKAKNRLKDDVKVLGYIDQAVYDMRSGQFVSTGRKVKNAIITENWEYVLELDGVDVAVNALFVNM